MRLPNQNSNNTEEWDKNSGQGVPYRGGAPHFPDQKPPVYEANIDPEDTWTHGEDVQSEELGEEPQGVDEPTEYPYYEVPIPVVVRELPDPHEHRSVRMREIRVDDTPVQICGRETGRVAVTISNVTAALTGTFISAERDVSHDGFNSVRLNTTFDTVRLVTHDALYAKCVPGEAALIAVVQEISIRT